MCAYVTVGKLKKKIRTASDLMSDKFVRFDKAGAFFLGAQNILIVFECPHTNYYFIK